MVVEPYKRVRPAPPRMGVLVDAGTVLDEHDGERRLEPAEGDLQVWAGIERVNELLLRGEGSALCWRGQPFRYDPDGNGYRVRVLGFPTPADGLFLAGLTSWRDWLAEEGASPLGSLASSSFSLLKAKLERKLFCSVPRSQLPPFRFTIGGRQELGPRGIVELHGDLRLYDLRAAYASRLGAMQYGGYWYRLDSPAQAGLLALERPVFCRARVRLAGSSPGPLVRREQTAPSSLLGWFPSYPEAGTVQGVWTWQELEAAREGGARVTLVDAWAHFSAGWQPFLPWWRAVERGRESLSGFGKLLAKATGNSLWGRFVIDRNRGQRAVLRYRRRSGSVTRDYTVLPDTKGERPAHDLGELLTGMVRAELYRAMRLAGGGLVSAHTDGLWAVGEVDLPGEWRLKQRAREIRVLDPQVLAYREPGPETLWRYVVAGWPVEGAGEQFERAWARRMAA